MLNDILETLQPSLINLIGMVLTAIIAYVATKFTAWSGIQIEAQHRAALHSALMTGVRAALDRGASHDQAVNQAVDYTLNAGAPDAVKALKASGETLKQIARSKLGEIVKKL